MANKSIVLGCFKFHEHILDFDGDGSGEKKPFKGVVGDIFNIFTKYSYEHGYNVTLVEESFLGSYQEKEKSYSGLLGGLENGIYDLVGVPVYYPLTDNHDKFLYTPALYGDTMTICSTYNVTSEKYEGNVFSMFMAVPSGLWISYVLSYFLFTFILKVGGKLLRFKYSSIWTTTSAYMEQNHIPSGPPLVSVVSTIVVSIVFLIMSYAKNSMRTDLVVVEKPIALTSYDDIIERNVSVAFSNIVPEYETFEKAPVGSRQRALFNNSFLIALNPGSAATFKKEAIEQEVVIIGRRLIGATTGYILLGFPDIPKNFRVFLGSDTTAKSYTNVFVFNSKHRGTHLEKIFHTIFSRISEHGFYHFIMTYTPPLIAGIVFGTEGTAPSLEQKVSHHIEVGQGEVISIAWFHFHKVLYVLLNGLVIGTLVLSIEVVRWSIKRICRKFERHERRMKRRRSRVRMRQMEMTTRNRRSIFDVSRPQT